MVPLEQMSFVNSGKVSAEVFRKERKGEAYHLATRTRVPAPRVLTSGTDILLEAGSYSYSKSEDIAYSVESDASSRSAGGESLRSDAESMAPSYEEKLLKRCPSVSSIVTYDEAISKLNDSNSMSTTNGQRSKTKQSSTSLELHNDEEIPRVANSAETAWTDDKHFSYLNSIEETFVRSLYGNEFHSVDIRGQSQPTESSEQDCVESRPMDHSQKGCELFKSLQRGCYDHREYYRPHFLDILMPSHQGVFVNPWIQHFNPKIGSSAFGHGGAECYLQSAIADGTSFGNHEEVDEKIAENVPDESETRLHGSVNSATARVVDSSILTKKRPSNLDPCNDAFFRSKKQKFTQQKLAEIDLEMEEQFVLGKLWPNASGVRAEAKHEDEHCHGTSSRLEETEDGGCESDKQQVGAQETPTARSPRTESRTRDACDASCESLELASSRVCSDPSAGHQTLSSAPRSSALFVRLRIATEREKVAESKSCSASLDKCGTISRQALDLGKESFPLFQTPDQVASRRKQEGKVWKGILKEPSRSYLNLDEDEECETMTKSNPRTRTWTWGVEGTRRLERSSLVESEVASGLFKDKSG